MQHLCCICEHPYEGFGHSTRGIDGGSYDKRCCTMCNDTVVIPTRMRVLTSGVLSHIDYISEKPDEQK